MMCKSDDPVPQRAYAVAIPLLYENDVNNSARQEGSGDPSSGFRKVEKRAVRCNAVVQFAGSSCIDPEAQPNGG
ncbi:hypothetical protein PHSY_005714 [Pseudozyma hubeiensis SY62]|uniref:Uncharacterized protein n=1 Tax=Pseudozyma hubeiensis (strain SY62) TaxID=1305764 RepID=R9PJ19_PSEHS|nr:hypothetical protein PHSY_005714 [Pseudozyma hubeiensis SY62]GAC98125.1 hypothetical protein PHSY_005714 [Pseudozyma hubeiensis SY62]